jgi:hypothetical protein
MVAGMVIGIVNGDAFCGVSMNATRSPMIWTPSLLKRDLTNTGDMALLAA